MAQETTKKPKLPAVSANLQDNMNVLKNALHLDKNFDVVYRTIQIGGKTGVFYFVDGFAKDEILQRILQFFMEVTPEEMKGVDAHEFSKRLVPYGETGLYTDMEPAVRMLLSGATLIFVEGFTKCLSIDCRTYPVRGVEEPMKDKVLRGSRDGFVETVIFNTALIRRRIRSPELVMEHLQVGDSSNTDIILCYMSDRADPGMLNNLRSRIQSIQIDALSMNQESLAECLCHTKWYNPFPKFRYSERPDTTAASVLEGSVAILVDNSPSAMLLPSSICDFFEEADDYYFPPLTGTYLRLCRMIITLFSVFVTPTYLLLTQNPEWVPDWLTFILIRDDINVPILLQLLLLELAIDGLRLAAVNTPNMLSTPLSIIAGIVLGEFSVQSGWFNSEVMLYMAFVTVANYTQTSFELGYALKFFRIILLVLTGLFNGVGFLLGSVLLVVMVVKNNTLSSKDFLYPFRPFTMRKLYSRMVRQQLKNKKNS